MSTERRRKRGDDEDLALGKRTRRSRWAQKPPPIGLCEDRAWLLAVSGAKPSLTALLSSLWRLSCPMLLLWPTACAFRSVLTTAA
eukprot:scaffold359_cov351-Pinguiococcus_pyrenoidosus.AAC.5